MRRVPRAMGALGWVLLAGLALGGCQPAGFAQGAADYAGTPKRMQIVAYKGPLTQAPEWVAFRDGVRRKLGECGVEVSLVEPETAAAAAGRATDASEGGFDSVLRILPVASFSLENSSGQRFLRTVTYETLVTERPSGRAVFRGRLNILVRLLLREPGEAGQQSAGALVRELARVGTVRTCPAGTISNPNFSPAMR